MSHAALHSGISVAESTWRRQAVLAPSSGAPAQPPQPLALAAAAAKAAPAAAIASFTPSGGAPSLLLPSSARLGPGRTMRITTAAAAAATVALPIALQHQPHSLWGGHFARRRATPCRLHGGHYGWENWGRTAGTSGAASIVAAARRRAGGDGGGDAAAANGGGNGAAVAVAEPLVERVEDTELYDETYNSYLSYAMSVIVSRAIPDVRDGLKPVHRRILYAMHELGLTHSKPFKKCARVVGEVLGKFHPHGDTAVYDSLVRMAQPFAMRAPLVDGHGNFGSLDNDPAAAMRYTECRLTRLAGEALLRDLGLDTVDWQPTFDESQTEPMVLPAVVPNLLVNGSAGIAVGLASNMPPHNLGEVVSALQALIADPRATTEQLLQHVRGPDFPTGGELLVGPELLQAYTTGRGSVVLRGKAFVERMGEGDRGGGGGGKGVAAAAGSRGRRRTAAAADGNVVVPASGGGGGREQIVITELPYQVFKSDLVAAVADLIESKQLEGASDVRDESDRTGVRVVVEVKRGHSGQAVLAQLYKSTKLQINFNFNCMALLHTRPRQMGLKDMLQAFLDFRCEVVQRRSSAALRSARQRLHLVEGFLMLLGRGAEGGAAGRLDAVVADVRAAADGAAARAALVARHGLSEEQAEAVLGLTLRRLTGLEAAKLEQEQRELNQSISELGKILSNRTALLAVVEREAAALAAAYPEPRRTALVAAADVLAATPPPEELLPAKPCLLLASRRGFLRRLPEDALTPQNRNTRGKSGIRLRSGDSLAAAAASLERDVLLLITPDGKMFKTRAANVPPSTSSSASSSQPSLSGAAAAGPSGISVANILRVPQSFPVAALVPLPPGLLPAAPAILASSGGGAAAAAAAATEAEVDAEAADEGEVEEGTEKAEAEVEAAAAAQGPCLVLCSRRGLIKRLVLRPRRDNRKGITVMSLNNNNNTNDNLRSGGSGLKSAPAEAAASSGDGDRAAAAASGPAKRVRKSRSAGGGGGDGIPEELGWAVLSTSPNDVVALVSEQGMALLFPASDLRASGPMSAGSLAMRPSRRRPTDRAADLTIIPADLAAALGGGRRPAAATEGGGGAADDDEVAEEAEDELAEEAEAAEEAEVSLGVGPGAEAAEAPRSGPVGPCLLIVTAHGIGKRLPLGQLRLGARRQAGVMVIRVASAERARRSKGKGVAAGVAAAEPAGTAARGADRVVAVLAVREGQEVVMASRNGVVVRQSVDGIAVQGRMTRGTFVMQLDDGDEVAQVVVAPAAAEAALAGCHPG